MITRRKQMPKRKVYEPKFKAQVVIECLKEEKTISQIASDYQVLSGMISKWKSQFLTNVDKVFENNSQKEVQVKKEYEKQIEDLYKEIGKLTTQLSWLKKKCGVSILPS
jgi:transposase